MHILVHACAKVSPVWIGSVSGATCICIVMKIEVSRVSNVHDQLKLLPSKTQQVLGGYATIVSFMSHPQGLGLCLALPNLMGNATLSTVAG